MTDYRDGTIYGWNGGECPVHPMDEVTVWLRGVRIVRAEAHSLDWRLSGSNKDIVGFYVAEKYENKEPKEPLTLWVNIYPDGGLIGAHVTEDAARQNADSDAIRVAVKFQEVKE